ncbi:MAG: CoA-binding protein [Spirochaetaceae bacterium]|jgi:redox-sensing transcriptional repressor|nr:CoA-binding protein [Spirochaetaceae bacterium]
MDQIPGPAKERLLYILRLLEASGAEDRVVTSSELEELSGWSSHTIRKDISFLGAEDDGTVGSSAGYASRRLIPRIKEALGLNRRRTFCVVGLGRLGSAYLNLDRSSLGEFELAAGFDINVNRVEILRSPAPLYPAYKMGELIGRLGIEIALLCVPPGAAQETAEKLAAAGIRGIINFVPRALVLPPEPGGEPVAVRNVFVTDELRALAVCMA